MSPLCAQPHHTTLGARRHSNVLAFRSPPTDRNANKSRREGLTRKAPKPTDPRSRRDLSYLHDELKKARPVTARQALNFALSVCAVFVCFFLAAYILQTADQILNAYTPEASQ